MNLARQLFWAKTQVLSSFWDLQNCGRAEGECPGMQSSFYGYLVGQGMMGGNLKYLFVCSGVLCTLVSMDLSGLSVTWTSRSASWPSVPR